MVAEHMAEYLLARKKEKASIARRVVGQIKEEGGRFLKRSPGIDVWVEVTDKKATEKTSQALREGLDVRHKTYRPEKMPRRDSDSSSENPRKRTRVVEGKVIDTPEIDGVSNKMFSGSSAIPELSMERDRVRKMEPMRLFFEPPRITKDDCHDTAAV